MSLIQPGGYITKIEDFKIEKECMLKLKDDFMKSKDKFLCLGNTPKVLIRKVRHKYLNIYGL
jgi:hypothetical protein